MNGKMKMLFFFFFLFQSNLLLVLGSRGILQILIGTVGNRTT